MKHQSRSIPTLAAALLALSFAGCDDSGFKKDDGADYSACTGEILNNQKVVCDDMIDAVETHCGFNLTVEPCSCADEVAVCTVDTEWLELLMKCGTDASDCGSYILCLEGIGESPSGCANPAEWDCLITETE